MAEDVKMLPCPWCGESLATVSVSEGSTFRWRKVDWCCTDGPEVRHDTMADDQAAAEADSRDAAIAAWNRRAHDSDALRAEVERLTTCLQQANWNAEEFERKWYLAQDQVERAEAQAAELREALAGARDWFDSQAKSISKGNGSSWDLMQVRDERDRCDAALSRAANDTQAGGGGA